MSDAKAIIGAEIIPNNHSDILERARLVQRVNAHWSDSICDCEECAEERFGLITPMANEIESLRSRLAEADALLRDVAAVVYESTGVYGFHMNGDLETWDYWPVFARIGAHLARQP
jgi:hypothetical protein